MMIVSPFSKPALTPPAKHPRLMLTDADLTRIRENINRPENALAVSILDELCARPVKGEGATPEYGSYNLGELLSAEALGFRALLSGRREDAEKAIDTIMLIFEKFVVLKGYMGARWGGHLIFTASEIYDWCYDYIDADTKLDIISRCEEIAGKYFEMGYPPAKQSAVSGHGCEAQLLRDLMAFSIAVYDERPDIYDFCAGRIFDEYVPAMALFYEGGAHTQGPTYGSYRTLSFCWCELLLRAVGAEQVFDGLERVADWLTYMTRPDGECLRLGDDFNENKALYNRRAPFCVPMFFAYALTGRMDYYRQFRDGLCRQFLLPDRLGMDYYDESSWGEGLISPVSMLIFDRFSGQREVPPLPACRYFGSPVGETVFKKDDTYVFMKCGIYWGSNHDHLDTGCFQFYHGAPLITDSGVYDSYNTPHRHQYLTSTAAHNCVTVERTDRNNFGEFKADAKYVGGTRRPTGGYEPGSIDRLISDVYRMAAVISHDEREDGCELVSDLSIAYEHSCSSFIRSASYDHARRLLTVRDEIDSLDPAFRKTFHMHCQQEPEIDGNTIIFRNKGHSARAVVVSPAGALITKVGGDGHRFEVDGTDFPPRPPYVAEEGWGEVRICPPSPSVHDTFIVEITAVN